MKARAGHDITVKVYQENDHTLNNIRYIFSGAYPPGYLDRMASWAVEKLTVKKEERPD